MKRLASDVGVTALSHIVGMVAIIGVQIILARNTTPTIFGQVALAQAMVTLVEATIVARGHEVALQVLGQNWSRSHSHLRAVSRTLMRYDIVISIAAYVVFVAVAFAVAPLIGANWLFAAALGLAVLLQIGYGMRRSLFLLNNQVKKQAVLEIAQSLVMLGLCAPLIIFFGEWGLVAGVLGAAAFKNWSVYSRSAALWRDVKRAPLIDIGDQTGQTVKHSSLHSVMRSLLSNGAANADMLILGMLGRPEIVAAYRVAKTLSSMPVRIAGPLWVVLRPRLLKALIADDHRRYCLIVFKAAAVFAVASVFAILLAWVVGGPVLLHFYGAAYVPTLHPMLVLMVGSAVFGAVTGWLPFTLVITSRKSLGTAIFVTQLVLLGVVGILAGGGSALSMAWVVLGCNVFISGVAWWALLAGRFRHVQDVDAAATPPA